MTRHISLSFYTITCGDEKVEYIPWWYANYNKVMGVALENEQRVAAQVRAVGLGFEEDVFLLPFVLQNAVFRLHDPLVYAPLIVFFRDVLPTFLRADEESVITFEPPFDANPALRLLVERVISGKKRVRIVTPAPRTRSLMLRRVFPLATTTVYVAETILSALARVLKPRRTPKSVLLSNFRHHSSDDTQNVFWGNFKQLLSKTKLPAPDIVYYNQILPIQRTYYVHALFDRNHLYLTECLSFDRLFTDMYAYSTIRVPTTFTYLYDGVDFGDVLLPLVQAYYRVLYPLLLKQRNALEGLLKRKPKLLFTDSEISFPSFHLGFMKRACPLVVLSNEVITPQYAMPPFGANRVRPSFDAKLVNGVRERNILAKQFGYPAKRLIVFPDPRYLDGMLNPKQAQPCVLFVSQAIITDVIVLLHARLRKTNASLPFLVKSHPLEDVADLQRKIGTIDITTERKLTFTPTYVVTHSSTLGLELLFQGSIVFFLGRGIFDVTDAIPFLFCKDVATVAQRIHALERDPARATKLRCEVRDYLTQRHSAVSVADCVKTLQKLSSIEINLKK